MSEQVTPTRLRGDEVLAFVRAGLPHAHCSWDYDRQLQGRWQVVYCNDANFLSFGYFQYLSHGDILVGDHKGNFKVCTSPEKAFAQCQVNLRRIQQESDW